MKSVFERIIDRELPANILYEDDSVIAFEDIKPVAPKHFLVVPKKKLPNIHNVSTDDLNLFPQIFSVIQKVANQEGLAENGYRVVTNIGKDGGQTVDHLHFHVVGGRSFTWPPG